MNPEFLVVRDMTQKDFLNKVHEAQNQLRVIIGDTAIMVAQNLGYCTENPRMADLGRQDALTAVEELTRQVATLHKMIVNLQDRTPE